VEIARQDIKGLDDRLYVTLLAWQLLGERLAERARGEESLTHSGVAKHSVESCAFRYVQPFK
jgi:hypothetical protein